IEAALAQVGLLPAADLELAAALRRLDGDARLVQSGQVLGSPGGIDNVEGLVPVVEALDDVRQQDAILFVPRVKEGADMSLPLQRFSRQMYLSRRPGHPLPPR